MPFVVDNSVTMAWCFEDEVNPYSEAVLERLEDTGAVVPAIWPLEAANVLLLGERRRRITEMQAERSFRFLESLPITVDTGALAEAFGQIVALAREYGLTVYDASYLELAMRRGLALATQDVRLSAAATRAGVPLVQ